MSRIDELIERLCPDGVEYKSLGSVGRVSRGKRVTRKDLLQDGKYPVFQNSLTPLGYYSEYNYPKETVFVICAGAAGQIGYSGSNFWAADDCNCIVCSENLFPRFIYHFLRSKQQYLFSKVRKASIPRLSKRTIEQLRIPVPPMEIQKEIVRLLDSFLELELKLELELELRKEQESFYVGKLLTFDCSLGRVPLSSVCISATSGATPNKSKPEYYKGGTIPWLRTQEVKFNEITETSAFVTEKAITETAVKWVPANCVIIAISGASAGRCAVNSIPLTTNQHCLSLEIDPSIALYKYIYYCVRNQYGELLAKKEGARGDLNATKIKSLSVPVPSLEKQRRIVSILDKFDALVNDLSSGIPAEIEARRKQYEYYRDKLLTFKEKPSD